MAKFKLPRNTKGQLLADLRDVFCLYDLEIVYLNTSDIHPEFLTQNEDGELVLRLRPFNWTPRREYKHETR